MGFSRPAAASGMAATLYAKAQNRLPLITASVRRADTMKKLWSMPVNTNATAIIGDNGGLAILYQPSDQPSETHLAAFTDTTGEKRWEIPSGEVCGITTTQLLLLVNDQLATIDLSNGQQLSYKDAPRAATASRPARPC
jgi:hypothetical protein